MQTYISRRLRSRFEDIVAQATESLINSGFTVVSTMDISSALRSLLHVNFRKYTCLGVMCPDLSYQAISLESHSGLALQCTVVIQEHENGEVEVSAGNPLDTLDANLDITLLSTISRQISARLRSAIDDLQVKGGRSVEALPA